MTSERPKCKSCGRALYRSIERYKRVAKGTSHIFCRNKDCSLFHLSQHEKKIEFESVKKIREKVQNILKEPKEREAVLLMLTLFAQEVGEDEFADILIKKYNLPFFENS